MLRTLFVAAAVLAGGPAVAQTTVVAATGSAAPGGGTFTNFNHLGPSLNAAGQIAFTAGASGSSSGVFLYTGGTGIAVARQGQAAPGGGTFQTFSTSVDADRAVLNAAGDVLYSGSTSTDGLWVFSGGSSSLVTMNEVPAPGIAGVNIQTIYRNEMHLSSAGRVTFYTDLDAPPDQALFNYTGTTGTPIAYPGLAAPGGNTFDTPGLFRASSAGHVTFQATMNSEANSGVFRFHNGTTVLLAQDGQAAPGGGGTFETFDGNPPVVNASGVAAFKGFTTNPTNTNGVFRSDGTTITAIAVQGQAAAGTGRTFVQFLSSSLEINASGQVAFQGNLSGTAAGNFGIYRGDGTTNVLIAQKGEAAPGTPAGVTFATLTDTSIVINDNGVVAFRSVIAGPGVTTATDTGLWYGTSTADLTLIAREGDVIVVNGVNRTLGDIPSVFEISDQGLAWRAVFVGGTQAILFTAFTPVPEPGPVLAVGGLALAAAWRRRRPA